MDQRLVLYSASVVRSRPRSVSLAEAFGDADVTLGRCYGFKSLMSRSRFDDLGDAELLVASRLDPDAFVALYDRWAAPLLAYFARRVRDPELAADLTAETLAIVFEKRGDFRDVGAPASAWLFKIAAHQLSRFARRRKAEMHTFNKLCLRRPELDSASLEAIEALIDEDPNVASRLAVALSGVSDGERLAVELRVIDDLSYREIAERLGCSVVAARVRVHRGLHRLNQQMEITT